MVQEKKLDIDFDAFLAAAVQRLVRLDQIEASLALAEATIVKLRGWNEWTTVEVQLEVPGDHFDALAGISENDQGMGTFGEPYDIPGTAILARVFTAVLPPAAECSNVRVKIQNDPVSEDWREQFKGSVGRGPVNQGTVPGVAPAKFVTTDGLRYRSKSEIKVADELRRREVIFFPLPGVVIAGARVREPDFLVLHAGRAGVLEIHGAPYHPASRASEDHAKSMPYRFAGAEHLIVDASEAYNTPERVVDKLLRLLEGNK
jgi:hypothetical protein